MKKGPYAEAFFMRRLLWSRGRCYTKAVFPSLRRRRDSLNAINVLAVVDEESPKQLARLTIQDL